MRGRLLTAVRVHCNECGRELDGDYDAVNTIGFRLLSLPEGQRPLGLGDGHLALKGGTVTTTGEDIAFDPGSTEGESHAGARGFSRG